MRSLGFAAALLLVAAGIASAQDEAKIGGRRESDWRREALELQRATESADAAAATCAEREAPAAYGDVAGYVERGARGRLRWVEVEHCDDERAAAANARRALADFEDLARRLGVPPGWLR